MAARMPSRVSVIVATRNRTDDLESLLESLKRQTVRPVEVIISDGGDDRSTERLCEETRAERPDLGVVYLKAPAIGATAQRNFAIDHLGDEADAVLFADDDVVLEREYIEVLSAVLERDTRRQVAGVAGVSMPLQKATESAYAAYCRFFLLGGRPTGRMLSSGVNLAPGEGCAAADWLFGCAMYRRELFPELKWASEMTGYALYDDVDLSLRARAAGSLVVCSSAQLEHRHSAGGRESRRQIAGKSVVNRYWLVLRHRRLGLTRSAYWWSVLGLLLLEGARVVCKRRDTDLEIWRGTIDGLRTIIRSRGRVLDDARG